MGTPLLVAPILRYGNIALSENTIYSVYCFDFGFHYHVGIYLRCMNVGMPQHLASRVDVAPGCQRHGGEGVAGNMGRDCLINADVVCYC
mgnify:CR=1 FL=1